MPLNQFNLQPSSFSIAADDPREVLFPEGTLLVSREGSSYRAGAIKPATDRQPTHQLINVTHADGLTTTCWTLSLDDIEMLGMQVVWFPQPAADETTNEGESK